MHKKIFIVSCLAIFAILQSLSAQNAHDNFLYWVYNDAKGKVAVTQDDKHIHKFWDLADGKLLFTYKEDDPGMSVKMLIYNVQKHEWLRRNMEYKNRFTNSSNTFLFFIDGRKVAEQTYPILNPTYAALHYKRARFAVNETKEGYSTIYLITENKTDVQQPVVEKVAAVKDPGSKIYSIEFSPSGRYLYSSGGCLVDVDNKKLLWYDSAWREKNDFRGYVFAFNNDETKMALTNDKKGMTIIDVQNGAFIDTIPLPGQFKKIKELSLFPCADMASFIITQTCHSSNKDGCSKKAWLVKKDTVIELIDPNQ